MARPPLVAPSQNRTQKRHRARDASRACASLGAQVVIVARTPITTRRSVTRIASWLVADAAGDRGPTQETVAMAEAAIASRVISL